MSGSHCQLESSTVRQKFFSWWSTIIFESPIAVILTTAGVIWTFAIAALFWYPLPSFNDPLLGFEARHTDIANRIHAWKLLREGTSWSGQLSLHPILDESESSALFYERYTTQRATQSDEPQNDDSEDEPHEQTPPSDGTHNRDGHHSLSDGKFFCGNINEGFANFVIQASVKHKDLLTLEAMKEVCKLDKEILRIGDSPYRTTFSDLCEYTSHRTCCPSWSLPNFIAALADKRSCFDLSANDIRYVRHVIRLCAPFYVSKKLTSGCYKSPRSCAGVPNECIDADDTMYTIFHYILPKKYLQDPSVPLIYTNLFIPIAKSTQMLPYYRNLTDSSDHEMIAGYDLGLKYALFEEYLLSDTTFILMAFILIILLIFIYIKSIFITSIIIISMLSALGFAYFMYTMVFQISFFPFMNLLAIVILIGVGSDNALITYHILHLSLKNQPNSHPKDLVEPLSNLTRSTLAASATTSLAFFASFFSGVTTIKCFSVFAGTLIICNFFINLLLVPPAVILSHRAFLNQKLNIRFKSFMNWSPIYKFIKFFRYGFCILSLILLSLAAYAVFYSPRLLLSHSSQFQIFSASHPFEKYDFDLKFKFNFEREKLEYDLSMPLRIIFGVLPTDTGSSLDPMSQGKLQFDPFFDMANQSTQEFLIKLCSEIRNASFYRPTLGPLLSNCVPETFKKWMEDRRCVDAIEPNKRREPCCQNSKFPYQAPVYEKCFRQMIHLLEKTPNYFLNMHWAGARFRKDAASSARAAVLILEYDTKFNFSYSLVDMQEFWRVTNEWLASKIEKAPKQLKKGWMVSDNLNLFALQETLVDSTYLAALLAILFAFLSVVASTKDLIMSLLTTYTVTCIILTIISILIGLSWALNIVESLIITLAIGMSVDFPLHYVNAFKSFQESTECHKVFDQVGSPILMSALTTGVPGLVMLFSSVLAFNQIGVFLVVLSIVGWTLTNFTLMPLLLIFSRKTRLRKLPKEHIRLSELRVSNPSTMYQA